MPLMTASAKPYSKPTMLEYGLCYRTPAPSTSSNPPSSSFFPDETGKRCWMVVTSPNADYIPIPRLGTLELRARENGWCGLEDFGQHPQFIIPGYEYLTCIQRFPPKTLRTSPTLDDCPKMKGSVVLTEMRMLTRPFYDRLAQYQHHYNREVEHHLEKHPTHTLAASLRRLMNQPMRKLDRICLTYPEIVLGVVEFQRTALAIDAFLQYVNLYLPRGSMGPKTRFIDLWVICSAVLPTTSPSRTTSIALAYSNVEFELPPIVDWEAKPPFRTVHRGPPSVAFITHLQRLNFQLLDIYQQPSFIETEQDLTLTTQAPLPASTGPTRQDPHTSRSSPYHPSASSSTLARARSFAQPAKVPTPSTITPPGPKYLTPKGDSFPPMIPSWKAAILAIHVKEENPLLDRHRIGYFFPDLRVFHDENNRSAFRRSDSSTESSGGCSSTPFDSDSPARPPVFPHRLRLFHLDLPGVASRILRILQWLQRHHPQPTSADNRRQSGYLERMTALLRDTNEVVWFNQEFRFSANADTNSIPPSVIAEVQWEIAELAFRFELRHIDKRLAPQEWAGDKESTRDDMICAVFPREVDGSAGGYSLSMFPNRDGGFASLDIQERIRAVVAFQSIVKSWPECPAKIKLAAPKADHTSLQETLDNLTHFYSQTFFDCFSRPPVVPHCLPAASLKRAAPRPFLDSLKVVE
ncbi:hypothetical protein BKA70DRAFT_1449804 [Coprinopsis sp. MPI-PUGE-AT-0042]|nr:hypothetical protein BKA70DRAFT_1449804 [Coprinopsis sp. MPI-PUGE-AT-0042]